MALNLKPIQRVVESYMTDECIVTRNSALTSDEEWDEDEGTYTKGDGDPETIYEGPCSIYSSGSPREVLEGAETFVESPYFLKIPADAPALLPEDQVTITAVGDGYGDVALVGKTCTVSDTIFDTIPTSRRVAMSTYTKKP